MNKDRSAAMFRRIGSYGKIAAVLIRRRFRALFCDAPVGDRREAHDMRGPGPKWRQKRAAKDLRG
jgi:hypothetical protein